MESLQSKREHDRAYAKTRVNIALAFERWQQRQDMKGLKTDTELAFFLLNR